MQPDCARWKVYEEILVELIGVTSVEQSQSRVKLHDLWAHTVTGDTSCPGLLKDAEKLRYFHLLATP